MAEPLLIFTHIPKAAGSTLAAVLRAQFSRSETLDVTPLTPAERVERMEHLPDSIRLVIGHARYGLHLHTKRPCRYFTLLREPVERVISAYYYIRRMPEHHLYARITDETGGLTALAPLQQNIQTKFIAGTPPRTEADAGELERAKQNLLNDYAAVGLAESFDESLLLMMKTFGWAHTPYTARNVTRGRPARDRHSEAELAAIRETNQLDRQLYDFARGLLDERLAAQPASFQRSLQAYRRRVRRLAWRESWRERLSSWLKPARAA